MLQGVGFTLERDPEVCGHRVEDQSVNPLKKVDNIEPEESQFPHLGGMDRLMLCTVMFSLSPEVINHLSFWTKTNPNRFIARNPGSG